MTQATPLRTAALTDTGRRRRHNEDSYVCDPPLFAIADGMGGAQAGEIASHLAAVSLQQAEKGSPSGEEAVQQLIQDANRSVYERARSDASTSGMGTTMTVALVEDDVVRFGHVGDSRAYLVRDHELQQLTEDHSLVGELVRSGRLSPEEADAHPHRSVITRVLGTDPEVDVDSFSVPTKPGDIYLLCSDGLSSMVDDHRILALLEEHGSDVTASARALVAEANANGGEDNITVILFQVAAIDDTIELPGTVAAAPPAVDADQDTLDGLDAVPVVTESAAVSGAARPKKTRRLSWKFAAVLVVILVAVAAGAGVYGLSRANFVGVNGNGYVAVYQGVPWNLPFGIHLYREVYTSRLLAAELSQPARRKLLDHTLRDRSASEQQIARYGRYVVGSQ
jgi:protein phosphatase